MSTAEQKALLMKLKKLLKDDEFFEAHNHTAKALPHAIHSVNTIGRIVASKLAEEIGFKDENRFDTWVSVQKLIVAAEEFLAIFKTQE